MLYSGIAASPGIAIGRAFLYDIEKYKVARYEVSESQTEEEIDQFKEAVQRTKNEILEVKRKVAKEMSKEYADIFGAHLLVLEDPFLIIEVIQKIRKEKINVEYALWSVLESLISNFNALDDDYMRERASDVYDIGRRILQNLVDTKKITLADIQEEVIVVSHTLSPADAVNMYKSEIISFVTEIGGKTSHTAIMARALEVPAVLGIKDISSWVRSGDLLIVDGSRGIVIVNPDNETLLEYEKRREKLNEFIKGLTFLKDLPAQTLDGYRVEITANIEIPEEVDFVKNYGAEGIGIYRTEFMFLDRNELPSEDEQFEEYRKVVSKMNPYPVIIRTIDVGGDKFASQLNLPQEMNPSLGLRAIRLCLEYPDVFKTQLKAIFRTSKHGKIKIMFPMITCINEVIQVKKIIEEVKHELREEKIAFDESMEVGIMIETPSSALCADILASEVDFFSIGTNDLIQYALAVDRGSERLAYLYNPSHPAILRLIKFIIEAAHIKGIWVGMCGEMAGDPAYAIPLLGMGLDEFSMSALSISEVKEVIRNTTIHEAKELVSVILDFSTPEEVEEVIKKKVKEKINYK
ncbi:MAG: phosphoenolpyruvate--protein phosphotransferase [bacterium]|nr:phosphoenolpyruvate--protein phosphotransferase [bacterium]